MRPHGRAREPPDAPGTESPAVIRGRLAHQSPAGVIHPADCLDWSRSVTRAGRAVSIGGSGWLALAWDASESRVDSRKVHRWSSRHSVCINLFARLLDSGTFHVFCSRRKETGPGPPRSRPGRSGAVRRQPPWSPDSPDLCPVLGWVGPGACGDRRGVGRPAPRRNHQVSPACTAVQNRSSNRTTRSNDARIAAVGPSAVTSSSSPAIEATQCANAGEDQLSTNDQ